MVLSNPSICEIRNMCHSNCKLSIDQKGGLNVSIKHENDFIEKIKILISTIECDITEKRQILLIEQALNKRYT